jgi:hypothetical protein
MWIDGYFIGLFAVNDFSLKAELESSQTCFYPISGFVTGLLGRVVVYCDVDVIQTFVIARTAEVQQRKTSSLRRFPLKAEVFPSKFCSRGSIETRSPYTSN